MNHVDLIGNLATDVNFRVKEGKNGQSVSYCYFNLGYTRRDKSCFIQIWCFNKLAESVTQYCRKGGRVAVSGELEVTDERQQDGTYLVKPRIIADSVDFIDGERK